LELSTAADDSASHSYDTLGAKTVTVYADDGHGHNVSATVAVTVIEGNQKPTIVSFSKSPASTATDGSYPPNTTITFTLVVNDYDGDMLGIAIDFGDGSDIYTTVIDSRPQTDETVTTTHNYTLANDTAYRVVVTVSDDQQHAVMTWATDQMDVKITAVAPPTPPHKVDNTALYAAIGIVAAIAVIAALLLLMRRKKKSAPAEIAPEPPPPGQ
jgi:LPXTG-motif cell wall-anchored protein